MRGRYKTVTAAMQTTPRAATGRIWVALTPSTSPKRRGEMAGSYWVVRLRNAAPRASIMTSVRAVVTS